MGEIMSLGLFSTTAAAMTQVLGAAKRQQKTQKQSGTRFCKTAALENPKESRLA
jgi:hypothetical protein